MTMIRLRLLPGELAVCRLPADAGVPGVPDAAELFALTRTRDELSVVCPVADAPEGAVVERGWRAVGIVGPLDFALTGVLAGIARPLADAGLSIFALSTYDTDYVLVRADTVRAALDTLRAAGYEIA